jgi:uncharacterized membrane protein
MILMALDHVRDYIGVPGNPTDVTRATAALFFTRWITHLCAPVFFLLTGTGAYLARQRRTTSDLSRFLLTRGLWLVLLELTVVRCLGYQFNIDYRLTMLVILWALGWSMVTLSVLLYLPFGAISALAAVTIAGHNLLPAWTLFHAQGVVFNTPRAVVFVAYPLIPWPAVTAAGYCLGAVFTWPVDGRRRFLWRSGIGLTFVFIVLRTLNVYGDPARWSIQASAARTALSFLNTTKYPPSLLFLSMTLGPALLLLAWFDRGIPRVLRPALTLGRVPMFYFLIHLPLIHLVAVGLCYARYGAVHWMFESPTLARYPFTQPPGWGYTLPVVYLVWIGVVIALYPLCRWYAGVKQRSRATLLSYL